MPPRRDLTGQTFSKLKVISFSHVKNGHACWTCLCECGKETVAVGNDLLNGHKKSCGCLRKESLSAILSKHNLTTHPLYGVWRTMRQRCYNSNNKQYPYYGYRGIQVCSEWKTDFLSFFNWALSSGYEKGLSIERIDNNANYCPENCKWATHLSQCNNQRSNIQVLYHGVLQPFAALFNGDIRRRRKVMQRINKLGWDADRAIDTP